MRTEPLRTWPERADVGHHEGAEHPPAVLVLALGEPLPGEELPPALMALGGSTLLERLLATLEAISGPQESAVGPARGQAPSPTAIPLVAIPAEAADAVRRLVGERARVLPLAGRGRRDALRAALPQLGPAPTILVHDAERALVPAACIRTVLAALDPEADAVVPALAVTDSVKTASAHGLRNVDRESLVSLQAPRLLRTCLLRELLAPPPTGADAPPEDEILAALALGARVRRVPGSHEGGAVTDRLSLWRAQISLGLARDVGRRRRPVRAR